MGYPSRGAGRGRHLLSNGPVGRVMGLTSSPRDGFCPGLDKMLVSNSRFGGHTYIEQVCILKI